MIWQIIEKYIYLQSDVYECAVFNKHTKYIDDDKFNLIKFMQGTVSPKSEYVDLFTQCILHEKYHLAKWLIINKDFEYYFYDIFFHMKDYDFFLFIIDDFENDLEIIDFINMEFVQNHKILKYVLYNFGNLISENSLQTAFVYQINNESINYKLVESLYDYIEDHNLILNEIMKTNNLKILTWYYHKHNFEIHYEQLVLISDVDIFKWVFQTFDLHVDIFAKQLIVNAMTENYFDIFKHLFHHVQNKDDLKLYLGKQGEDIITFCFKEGFFFNYNDFNELHHELIKHHCFCSARWLRLNFKLDPDYKKQDAFLFIIEYNILDYYMFRELHDFYKFNLDDVDVYDVLEHIATNIMDDVSLFEIFASNIDEEFVTELFGIAIVSNNLKICQFIDEHYEINELEFIEDFTTNIITQMLIATEQNDVMFWLIDRFVMPAEDVLIKCCQCDNLELFKFIVQNQNYTSSDIKYDRNIFLRTCCQHCSDNIARYLLSNFNLFNFLDHESNY